MPTRSCSPPPEPHPYPWCIQRTRSGGVISAINRSYRCCCAVVICVAHWPLVPTRKNRAGSIHSPRWTSGAMSAARDRDRSSDASSASSSARRSVTAIPRRPARSLHLAGKISEVVLEVEQGDIRTASLIPERRVVLHEKPGAPRREVLVVDPPVDALFDRQRRRVAGRRR